MCLRLDTLRFTPVARGVFFRIVTKQELDPLVAQLPVWPIDIILADRGELVQRVLVEALIMERVRWADRAGSHQDHFVNVVDKERLLKMSKCIEHLDSTLRPTYVEDFVSPSVPLDHLDVRHIVVDAHLGPGPSPELLLPDMVIAVLLRVLRTPVVPNPDVVTSIGQLQVHRHTLVVVAEPGSSIARVTVLNKHWWLGGSVWLLKHLACHVERSQDESIFGVHLVGLPGVTELEHLLSESWIVMQRAVL